MASCMLALAVASSFPKSNKSAQIASALFVFLFNFFTVSYTHLTLPTKRIV